MNLTYSPLLGLFLVYIKVFKKGGVQIYWVTPASMMFIVTTIVDTFHVLYQLLYELSGLSTRSASCRINCSLIFNNGKLFTIFRVRPRAARLLYKIKQQNKLLLESYTRDLIIYCKTIVIPWTPLSRSTADGVIIEKIPLRSERKGS